MSDRPISAEDWEAHTGHVALVEAGEPRGRLRAGSPPAEKHVPGGRHKYRWAGLISNRYTY